MSHPIDNYVGARIRFKRKTSGLTQTDLGDKVGLTFQQIQKYEKGENRVSASKLYQISTTLNTTVSFFFDGYRDAQDQAVANGEKFSDSDSVDLVKSFNKISDDKLKKKLKMLIDSL